MSSNMALGLTTYGSNSRSIILKIHFSTSAYLFSNWRQSKKLKENPSRYGPLTNLPDYSFVDGRLTPLSHNKFKKLKIQEDYCKRIVELNHELDVGLATYYKNQEQMEENKNKILSLKLKPKGVALLQNKKNEDKN